MYVQNNVTARHEREGGGQLGDGESQNSVTAKVNSVTAKAVRRRRLADAVDEEWPRSLGGSRAAALLLLVALRLRLAPAHVTLYRDASSCSLQLHQLSTLPLAPTSAVVHPRTEIGCKKPRLQYSLYQPEECCFSGNSVC
eukprot:3768587-Rhodomonas_salina.2